MPPKRLEKKMKKKGLDPEEVKKQKNLNITNPAMNRINNKKKFLEK